VVKPAVPEMLEACKSERAQSPASIRKSLQPPPPVCLCQCKPMAEKKDLDAMLPRLWAYMGHYTLKETAYYVHLLPENLFKNKGIDWEAFSEIIPKVDPWQE